MTERRHRYSQVSELSKEKEVKRAETKEQSATSERGNRSKQSISCLDKLYLLPRPGTLRSTTPACALLAQLAHTKTSTQPGGWKAFWVKVHSAHALLFAAIVFRYTQLVTASSRSDKRITRAPSRPPQVKPVTVFLNGSDCVI